MLLHAARSELKLKHHMPFNEYRPLWFSCAVLELCFFCIACSGQKRNEPEEAQGTGESLGQMKVWQKADRRQLACGSSSGSRGLSASVQVAMPQGSRLQGL